MYIDFYSQNNVSHFFAIVLYIIVLIFRTVDVYYVMYRGRSLPEVVEATPEEEEDSWEEQVVETVNNTINHMVSNKYSRFRYLISQMDK